MTKVEIKFGICDEVVYLNTATARFEKAVVKGIRVAPTGISKDESGKDVLDGFIVLYDLKDGPIVSQEEVFASEQECRQAWVDRLSEI